MPLFCFLWYVVSYTNRAGPLIPLSVALSQVKTCRRTFRAYLLFRDIDGLIEDDPDRRLPAAGVCGGPFIRQVLLGVRQ